MLAGGMHLGELVEDTLSVLRLEAGVAQVDAGRSSPTRLRWSPIAASSVRW
jgi:hypothetical protein